MTHGRPALCGTVRRCRLHGVAGRYRGPHTPRSVSCALALEADLLLQQETPLCGVPSPGDRATQTFHRLPASAAHSWVHQLRPESRSPRRGAHVFDLREVVLTPTSAMWSVCLQPWRETGVTHRPPQLSWVHDFPGPV